MLKSSVEMNHSGEFAVPVRDKKVFQKFDPENNQIVKLFPDGVSDLWSNFEFFQLTEVMRQRDDVDFVNALNHLVVGEMTENDTKLIRSRLVEEQSVPETAIRLYWASEAANDFNYRRIREVEGELIQHQATDSISGKISAAMRKKETKALQHAESSLPYSLDLKIGIEYMMTVNQDIQDSLVNGATGVLRYIEFRTDRRIPKVLYIEFDFERTGQKTRREHANKEINKKWTPIKEMSIEIVRENKKKVRSFNLSANNSH